jgi:hypothetical protein
MQFSHKHALAAATLALAIVVTIPMTSQSRAVATTAGRVLLVKKASPEFDKYTNTANLAMQQWMRDHFWRMLVYSPYFDEKTSWYPNAWIYLDSYAIYTSSSDGENLADTHPDWILRDARKSKLYIPWECNPKVHACPQYAADFSNPGFRQWWVDKARASLARGRYKGLWIDDVNFDWRVSDGDGTPANPIDPRTGHPMIINDWRRYFAEFLEKVRRDLPEIEIVTNSIWYAGGPARDLDTYVQRQIAASDIITIEHGVNDRRLTGGNGKWSLKALLAYIDRVNRAGKGALIGGLGEGDPNDLAAVEYAVACYFLTSNGNNAVGDFGKAVAPENWWPGFDLNLGAALAYRFTWKGLLRRDFTGGMVLVNPPQGQRITVAPPGAYKRVDGSIAKSIVVGPAQGLILIGI